MLRGEFDEAWKISEQLQKLGPNGIQDPSGKKNPEMWLRHNFNRGWFLLNQGKFLEGMELLESGRFLNVYGGGRLPTTKPIWQRGDPLEGKTIILCMEGGFGDEIIHARFAKTLGERGAKVILAASVELHSIFSRIPGVVKVIPRSKEAVDDNPHDYWIPGFSAGWLLYDSYEDLPNDPYITPIPESVTTWANIVKSDKIKVGIRWSGNPKFEHQQFRNFPSELLTDLAKHKELQLFSLQRDNDTKELDPSIYDLQYILLSWEDTAAAIANLDLVITSCTSVAHMAAAMGKETWVITPTLPYHTWAHKAPESRISPWYTSVRIFRQTKLGKWDDTFKLLYEELENKFNLGEKMNNPNTDIKTITDVKIKRSTPTKQQQLSFIAGLPNSGADQIAKALSSETVSVHNKSGLFETLAAVHYNWSTTNSTIENKADVLEGITSSYFKYTGKPQIIDNNMSWINMIPLLETIMGDAVKIVVPVRNPAEILSVYELNRNQNALQANRNELTHNMSTITARCYHYSRPEGELGLAHSQTLDAITAGYKDRLLFVDYNKLCNEPTQQVKRICDFLGIEFTDKDYSEIITKQFVTPVDVIGFDLFNTYNSQIFWQNWI